MSQDVVKAGAVFKHFGERRRVEVAHVLKVTHDHRKIPHVQFSVHVEDIERGHGDSTIRTLNVKDFLRYFSEPVSEN
jgi:hypothetical protein